MIEVNPPTAGQPELDRPNGLSGDVHYSYDHRQPPLRGLSNYGDLVGYIDLSDVNQPDHPLLRERVEDRRVLHKHGTSVVQMYSAGLARGRREVRSQLEKAELEERLMQAEVRNRCDAKFDFILNDTGMSEMFDYMQDNRDADDKVVLLFLDINLFGKLNKEIGHLAGDNVLAQFARELVDSIRQGDAVGRHGGDEFMILLNLGSMEAQQLEQLLARITRSRRLAYRDADGRYGTTEVKSSTGYTDVEPGDTYSEALERANYATRYIKDNCGGSGLGRRNRGSKEVVVTNNPLPKRKSSRAVDVQQ